jgi:hypothetical protein
MHAQPVLIKNERNLKLFHNFEIMFARHLFRRHACCVRRRGQINLFGKYFSDFSENKNQK